MDKDYLTNKGFLCQNTHRTHFSLEELGYELREKDLYRYIIIHKSQVVDEVSLGLDAYGTWAPNIPLLGRGKSEEDAWACSIAYVESLCRDMDYKIEPYGNIPWTKWRGIDL